MLTVSRCYVVDVCSSDLVSHSRGSVRYARLFKWVRGERQWPPSSRGLSPADPRPVCLRLTSSGFITAALMGSNEQSGTNAASLNARLMEALLFVSEIGRGVLYN